MSGAELANTLKVMAHQSVRDPQKLREILQNLS